MQIWRRWTLGGHRSILIFFYYNIVVFCSWLSELTAFVANCENKRDFYLFCLRPFRLLPEHHKSWAAIYCKKNKHRCLFSAPCSAVHYLDRSACSVGRQAFLIVQSLLMKTHWRIYLLLLALSSEREGETVPVHLPRLLLLSNAHTHCSQHSQGVPVGRTSTLPTATAAPRQTKLCCAMMCRFLFMLILPISLVCVSTNFSLLCSNSDYHITPT